MELVNVATSQSESVTEPEPEQYTLSDFVLGSSIRNNFTVTSDESIVYERVLKQNYSINSYAPGIYTVTEINNSDVKKSYTFDEEGNFLSYSNNQPTWVSLGRADGGNLYYNASTGEYCQLYTDQNPNETPPTNTFI